MTTAADARPGPGLLRETFVHLVGIGTKTERRLWQRGIVSWDELRASAFARRAGLLEALDASAEAMQNADVDYFFGALPARERWRAFADFGQDFVAVDIETTGLSVYDEVTLIGIEHAGKYETFIRGANLDDAAEVIAAARGLITFNGALFDLPFVQRTFPDLELPKAHVDLRFLSRRVGFRGSLKAVEEAARLKRHERLDDISGYAATLLWSEFEHDGHVDALERLILYNAADTCVLRPLAELVTTQLREDLIAVTDAADGEDGTQLLFQCVDGRSERVPPRTGHFVPPLPTIKRSGRSLRVGKSRVPLPKRRDAQPLVTLGALQDRMRDPHYRIVGIDLTGSEQRPSGWALLEGDLCVTGQAFTDDELLEQTLAAAPRVVSVDSPLSIPVGRDCTDDSCGCRAVGGITRQCERELKRRGVNVYPCLIQSMQSLTRRGMLLAAALRARGVEVIESYPGAAQDIMRIPRKRAGHEHLRAGLVRFGIRGLRPVELLTHDELDAVTSATVGAFYLADAYEPLGNDDEEFLIIPQAMEGLDHGSLPTSPPGPSAFFLVGPAAASVLMSLKRPHARTMEELSAERPLIAVETGAEYERALATLGPRARAFHILPAGTRVRRRPSLYDNHRREDAPDLHDAVRAWLRQWRRSRWR